MAKATGPTYQVAFKRRRARITNYAKRLALLKSNLPRLVVRKTNRGVLVQVIEFTPKFDKTVISVSPHDLKKLGWPAYSNLPTAYLTGLLCASLAKKKKINKVVLDVGLSTPTKGSFIFTVQKGAIDGGLEIPVGKIEVDMDRASGKHIADYAASLKNSDKYKKLFSKYVKAGIDPENLPKMFEETKKKILG